VDWTSANIYKASYKGVEFDCVLTAVTRRQKRHRSVQYPNRPGGKVWDGARKPVAIELTAIFFGDGWKTGLSQLVKACDEIGAGTLVHPLYGEIWCLCTDYNDDARGEYPDQVAVTLHFIEASQDANAWHNVVEVLSPAARAESLATSMDEMLEYSGSSSFGFYVAAVLATLASAELTVQSLEACIAENTQAILALADGIDITTSPLDYDYVADAYRLTSLIVEAGDLYTGSLARLTIYSVQREVTLMDVAAECGCTPEDIETYNVIADPFRIPAQTLLIVPA